MTRSPQDTDALAAELAAMTSRMREYPVPRVPLARRAGRALGTVAADLLAVLAVLALIACWWLLAVLWHPARAVLVLRRRHDGRRR